MAIVPVEAILGPDALRPRAPQRVGRLIGAGNLFLPVDAIGVAGQCVNPGLSVERDAQREQQFDIAPAASAAAYGHSGFAAGEQYAWRRERLPAKRDLARFAFDAIALDVRGETGAAQYYRDARIVTIYEGTTAIQANDLVGRKTLRDGGATAFTLIETIMEDARALRSIEHSSAQALGEKLAAGCAALRGTIEWMLDKQQGSAREVFAGAVPYLHLWGTICGGWMHARRVCAAGKTTLSGDRVSAIRHSAHYFSEQVLPLAPALAASIKQDSIGVLEFSDNAWEA